jgi:hypothetical protein
MEKYLFSYRSQNKGRSGEKSDIFKDSLSEGLKAEKSSSSSEEEIGDINIEEDEDEEQIIQKRRKQREELLRVNFNSYFKSYESSHFHKINYYFSSLLPSFITFLQLPVAANDLK